MRVWFRGKSSSGLVWAFRFTPEAAAVLDERCETLTAESTAEGGIPVARPDAVEALIRKHGRSLTLADLKRLSKQQ